MGPYNELWKNVIEYLDSREGPSPQDDSCIKDIESLLRQGLDINTTDSNGETLLHKCRDFRELAAILLFNGADVNLQDHEGNTPFHDCLGLRNSYLLYYMKDFGVDLLIANKQGCTRYDNIKKLVNEGTLSAGKGKLADRIVAAKKPIVLAVCVPEQYYEWIGNTFSAEVVGATGLSADTEISSYMMIITNTDDVSQEQLQEIKRYQERAEQQDLNVEFIYVTLKQLQYYSNNPYWVMYGDENSEEEYCRKLSYVNSLLRSNGLRCVREKWLFLETVFANGEPEEDVYEQTSLWANSEGRCLIPTLSLGRSNGKRNDWIRIEGFHDDVFVIEGVVPIDMPPCDMEKEILYFAG